MNTGMRVRRALRICMHAGMLFNLQPFCRTKLRSRRPSDSVGVRADLPVFPDRPQATVRRVLRSSPQDSKLPPSCSAHASHDIPTPRFHMDAKADHSIQFRGRSGHSHGRIPYAWIDNLYSHTGMDYVHIKETGQNSL